MIEFVNVYLFWIMIIPFVIFSFLIFTTKERLERIFSEDVLNRIMVYDSMPLKFRHLGMLVSIFLMIVALARPVIDEGDKKVDITGLSMLYALDISGSMRSEDVYPNRLEFAKKKMGELLDSMPTDMIALEAFAYTPFLIAPFSSDKESLKMMLSGINDTYISFGSTDFEELGNSAVNILEDKKPKILVLFSDGGDKEALKGFKEVLKSNNIELFVVLVGTKKGSPVLDENHKPLKLKDGTIAITQRNDELGKIAQEMGGAYVVASNGKADMKRLSEVIHTKYKNQIQGSVNIKDRVELFYYPLALALLILLISLSSTPRFRRDR
jgi:Ca-activated chloride channel family protein